MLLYRLALVLTVLILSSRRTHGHVYETLSDMPTMNQLDGPKAVLSKKSVHDFNLHVQNQNFDFKNDIILQIRQILMNEILKRRLTELRLIKTRCLWRGMMCLKFKKN